MRSHYSSIYPVFKTVRCVACGCLVEVRMDHPKMIGQTFCGRPCQPRKHRNSMRPIIVKVHKASPRPGDDEYRRLLRKHMGLDKEEER